LFALYHDPLSFQHVPRLYQRTSPPPPEKLRPFTTHALRRFYAKGFDETDTQRRWAGLWRKQFKLRLGDGARFCI
jgi:hypothetical protein